MGAATPVVRYTHPVPLHVHRSPRMESLVEALASVLSASWPDPFEPVPIVVGSRGMERWLRHELTARLGIAAQLVFPFPRPAMQGAATLVLEPHRLVARSWFEGSPDAWSAERVGFQLVPILRRRREEPAFTQVARYLGTGEETSFRELAFAREVADVLDRLMHDRPLDAIHWASKPEVAPEKHRWLAELLAEVGAGPAKLHESLVSGAGRAPEQPIRLLLFGLSTLGPGDRARIFALSRHIEIRLFLLTPSEAWWQHILGKREAILRLHRADEGSREDLERELSTQNVILASLGLPSRDLQWWLEEGSYDDADAPFAESPPPATRLHALQSWIREAGEMSPQVLRGTDDSLSFNATWGALRQVESLRDDLRSAFAADPTLDPRDVLVMTPNLATFAPLVQAVFAEVCEGVPAIPTSVADLGLRRTNVVAETLLAVLGLLDERVTARALVSMLSLPAARTRFGLDADDVATIRELADDSGMRWALDAADRARVGQPALDQNTLQFGLARLALGVLMPDDDPLGVVFDVEGNPLAPRAVNTRDHARLVGVLGEVISSIARLRASSADWRTLCGEILDGFTATSEAAAWLRTEVVDSLDQLQTDVAGLRIPVATLRRLLEGRFEQAARGDRPVTGAVTVCALQPMRSVPFRLIALLGMDDGAFPTGATPRAWDPMAVPESGERDVRATQRHLLLETILSARDRLWIYWTGFDARRGRPLPAAVPVEELVDCVSALSGTERAAIVRAHLLQPWSSVGFDPQLAAAARAAWAQRSGERSPERVGLRASIDDPPVPEQEPPRTLSLDTFAANLSALQRMFVHERLRLSPSRLQEPIDEREPIELSGLDAWSIRQLAMLAEGATPEAVTRRLAGEGSLPLRAGGEVVARAAIDEARAVREAANALRGESVAPSRITVVLGDGLVLSGRAQVERERDGARMLSWMVASKADKPKHHLRAYVHLIAARAAGLPVEAAGVVGTDGCRILTSDLDADASRAALEALASVWRAAREGPVPCFTEVSWATVCGEDPAEPWQWDLRDESVAALYGADFDLRGAGELAWQVWGPVLEAVRAGEDIAGEWGATAR